MLREPIDLPPIVSVELIQIKDKTNIPYAPKVRKIIEDVKSPITKTPVYNLKKKILSTYSPPILIKEVM